MMKLNLDHFSGYTVNKSPVVRGDFIFDLKDAHGLPLDFSIDFIYNQKNMVVDWTSFVDRAVKCKWYGFQIYEAIEQGLKDADIEKSIVQNTLEKLRGYMWYNCPGFPGYDERIKNG